MMAAAEVMSSVSEKPSLKNLTSRFGKIPSQPNQVLQALGAPHVESFNYMLEKGLYKAIKDILPVEFALPNGSRISLVLQDARINKPTVSASAVGVKDVRVYPAECRQRGITYRGQLLAQLIWSCDGRPQAAVEKILGEIPIMVKSKQCNLDGLSPKELVSKGEHEEEFGGYFIVKGHEKLMRMLLSIRRNYPLAIQRGSWKSRGKFFSEKGILIRCLKDDQTSTDNVLHYINDGTAKYMFSYRRELFFVPVMMLLKALVDVTDQFIYNEMMAGMEHDKHFESCVVDMLRKLQKENLHHQSKIKNFIGKTFRVKLGTLPSWYTDAEICNVLLQKCVAIHLWNPMDKFNLIVLMTKKLFSVVNDSAIIEGSDSVMMQEIILGGHVYLQLLKDKLGAWLTSVQYSILKRAQTVGPSFQLTSEEMKGCVNKTLSLEPIFETFLATGNMPATTGVGLPQFSGLSIMVENLNRLRYCAHFKSVHRGAYFTEMRTTEARQLLPDAWGFICPVHTPDGAPCGLLNHLTSSCIVVNSRSNHNTLPSILVSLGMYPLHLPSGHPPSQCYTVVMDGKVLGRVPQDEAKDFVGKLRLMKVKDERVPKFLEIVLVPKKEKGQFPGIFLFTGEARMMRPVWNLAAHDVEWIGTFEQVYLDICIHPKESYPGITTHQELKKTSFLSNLANLIPMPDCNQSPRNMYQCQMGKQTMGTPCHTWQLQTETKLYRLQTPASPLFRPAFYDKIGLDNYAMGTNAVVAVISYTGYDMEDAMMINKSSLQRGLAHGSIYKSEFINLSEVLHCNYTKSIFQRDPNRPDLVPHLDADGLPYIGSILEDGCPYYCFFNTEEGRYQVKKYGGKEQGHVDTVKICGNNMGIAPLSKICITIRITRNPTVGDKFASRAGQKGICSQQWPQEDLPFTESGLVPDIIFNPHGFPSRMTIAMMIESMAGKSGAVHGLVHDATPFRFTENDTAIDYFGRLLEAAGYDYYGTEKMYSGVDGREMEVAVFFGIVHYQRLRHMVSDKWQVRSVGPVDTITQQPIKGRRRGGGVRFGEMERDSLLSHGAAFLLQDRLFHCSDKTTIHACQKCGSLLSTKIQLPKEQGPVTREAQPVPTCGICNKDHGVGSLEIPYIFKFLVTQLASMNIKVKMDLVPKGEIRS